MPLTLTLIETASVDLNLGVPMSPAISLPIQSTLQLSPLLAIQDLSLNCNDSKSSLPTTLFLTTYSTATHMTNSSNS